MLKVTICLSFRKYNSDSYLTLIDSFDQQGWDRLVPSIEAWLASRKAYLHLSNYANLDECLWVVQNEYWMLYEWYKWVFILTLRAQSSGCQSWRHNLPGWSRARFSASHSAHVPTSKTRTFKVLVTIGWKIKRLFTIISNKGVAICVTGHSCCTQSYLNGC